MAIQNVNLGRIVFMWKGEWEANKTYYLYDIVRVDKLGIFFATQPHIATNENKPSLNSEVWDLAFDFSADVSQIDLSGYVTLEKLQNEVLNKVNTLTTSNNNLSSQVESVKSSLANKADKSTTVTKTELNSAKTELSNDYTSKLANKADKSTTYTKTEVDKTYRKIADSYTKAETNTQIKNAVNATTHRYKAMRCNPSANTIQWQTGGMSISKQNNYTVKITHNLGTTNYAVTALININASIANVVSIAANYCTISCHKDNNEGLPTIMNVSIFY